MRYVTFALAAALSAATASAAHADDGHFYVGGFVGDRFGNNEHFRGANLAGDPRVIQTPTKDGIFGGVTLGAVVARGKWGRARVEGEISASRNTVNRLILNDVQRQLLEGRKSTTTEMVNVVYDTPKLANLVRFSIGGGIGAAGIDYDVRYNVSAAGPTINIPTSVAGQIGYQAIGGMTVDVAPHLELTADVRYLTIAHHQIERFNQSMGTLDSVLNARYHSTAASIGFRYFL